MTHLKIVSFTKGGDALGARLAAALPDALTERYARGGDASLRSTALRRFAQQAMFDCDGLIFIGAAGIAVRAVAPYLRGKAEDPAVLVADEAGRFVVPLLSGHLGGANLLAERVAAALGATPVLTTATDVRRVFAVDTWAASQGFAVGETARIREISAALLRGETVGFASAFPVRGELPPGVTREGAPQAGFAVTWRADEEPFPCTLHVTPRALVAGIGCRRGKSMEEIAAALGAALAACGASPRALAAVATIDIKRGEPGLLALCRARDLPLLTYSADALARAEGTFTPSAFVRETVGVDNVCERAAVCGARGGALLQTKTARDGVTVALALTPTEVVF